MCGHVLMMFVEDEPCIMLCICFSVHEIQYFILFNGHVFFYFCSLIQEYLKEPFFASIQMIYTLAENEKRRKSCVDTLTKYTHTSCMYMYLSNTSIVYNSLFFAFIIIVHKFHVCVDHMYMHDSRLPG